MTAGLEEIEAILDPDLEIPMELEPELVDMLPRGYLSPSQVTMFLKCPHSWELAYVDGKPRKTVARMFQGIFVHNASEVILKERLSSGILPSQDVATDAFSDAFDKSKNLIEDWEGEEEGSVKDTGIKCTKAYYDEAAPDAMPITVEKTFTAVFRSADGKVKLPILGRIDSEQVQAHTETEYQEIRSKIAALAPRTDGKTPAGFTKEVMDLIKKPLRIHDLKVVTDKWSPGDLENDLQFALYAGAEHIPDVQVDMVVKGRAKVPRPHYEKLTGVITSRQVQHVQRVVEGVARSIALGNFPLTDPGNWWCSSKWCSMWSHCRGKTT
jgi:PD-(D/E)XK nuclease superfamily